MCCLLAACQTSKKNDHFDDCHWNDYHIYLDICIYIRRNIYIYTWFKLKRLNSPTHPNFNLSLSPDYRRLSPGCMFRDACGHRALQQTRVECVRTSRWCQTCPLQKWHAEKTTKKHFCIEKAETKDEHENDKSKDKAHNNCIVVIKIVIVSHIVILLMTTDIHLPKNYNGWNLKTPQLKRRNINLNHQFWGFKILVFGAVKKSELHP